MTNAPVEMNQREVNRLAQTIRECLRVKDPEKDLRNEVTVITRGGSRVFMERKKPYVPRNAYVKYHD